jgi:xanthine/uracil/vitamin C permease (AzgA family)
MATNARSSPRPELTPEEAANWRLAKLFDLRSFIGVLFTIFGVLVTISGIAASQASIDQAAGINLSLWVGLIMLVIGLIFLAWLLAKPPRPITAAEAEATRRANEEFGTQMPGGH